MRVLNQSCAGMDVHKREEEWYDVALRTGRQGLWVRTIA
jgi:hypothetical protein